VAVFRLCCYVMQSDRDSNNSISFYVFKVGDLRSARLRNGTGRHLVVGDSSLSFRLEQKEPF
jgi:hypothetical protein